MSERKVVVTGLGMLTPLGNTVEDSWHAMLAGKSGIGLIDTFDVSQYRTHFAGAIKHLNTADYLPSKIIRSTDLFIQYGLIAAMQAMEDAGLQQGDFIPERAGIAIGSGIGGISLFEAGRDNLVAHGPRKISPFFVPSIIVNMIAGHASMMYGLKGPNIAISTACTTGVHNIGFAGRMISHGDADIVLAGGAEMATSPLGLGGFCAARALSTRNDNPQAASRPWDKDRDGFVLSDGAGILVLEEYEHAKKRNATIYGELLGFGMSSDAYHITAPNEEGQGAANAMQNALKDARINASDINYINAHGTSTKAGDIAESNGIKRVLSIHAKSTAISSTKSMLGHMLGAAGAVEAIISLLVIKDQAAPPTINLDNPDEGCDLDYIPHCAREMSINTVLTNSFGFGGTNGSLIFQSV